MAFVHSSFIIISDRYVRSEKTQILANYIRIEIFFNITFAIYRIDKINYKINQKIVFFCV